MSMGNFNFADILVLIFGTFITTSWLMWWFNTSLAVHILEVLRFLGWRKKDEDFWAAEVVAGFPKVDLSKWTRSEFDSWTYKMNPYLSEMLACPGCLSFHAAFWVSLTLNLMTSLAYGFCFERVFTFILGWYSWPFLANVLLKKTKG